MDSISNSNVKDFYDSNAENRYNKRGSISDVINDYIRLMNYFASLVNNGLILDAGCGVGRDQRYFESKDIDCIGIDISREQLSYARQSKILQMDMKYLGFDNNVFNGIWCPNSIFFVEEEDAKKILDNFYRVVVNSGVIAVGFKIGNKKCINTMERWSDKVKYLQYSEDDVYELYERSNLTVSETKINTTGNKKFLTVLTKLDN